MSRLIIAISGVARSGKDTFADLLEDELIKTKRYLNFGRLSLAFALKKGVQSECFKKFNIDSFTQNEEEKKIIRPFLVERGKKYRLDSKGTYFSDILDKQMRESRINFNFIITDIRYTEYTNDELQWLKKKNGILVHVTRYVGDISDKILPPNRDEAFNDPILDALADFNVVWPTTDNINIKKLFIHEFLKQYGKRIINT